jgi:ribonuclease R
MAKKKKRKFQNKKKSGTFNKKKLKNEILSILYEEPAKSINYKQIATWLGIKDIETRKLTNVVLQELHDDDYLEQISRGKYKLKAKTGTASGVVELQPQGFAYVNSEEVERPVLISSRNLKHAMEGDKVKIRLYAQRKKHDLEGEVIEILERKKTVFVGVVQTSRNFAFLMPVGKIGFDIFIPLEKLNGAKSGQKAIAEISEWPENAKSPFGRIIEVLGDVGDNDA